MKTGKQRKSKRKSSQRDPQRFFLDGVLKQIYGPVVSKNAWRKYRRYGKMNDAVQHHTILERRFVKIVQEYKGLSKIIDDGKLIGLGMRSI